MGQWFLRSDPSVSQKTTDDRGKSTWASNLSFKHILRLSLFRSSNYSPPATYRHSKKVDVGKAPVKFDDIGVSRPACFVGLPSSSRLSPARRYANIKFDLRNNISEKVANAPRRYKPLIYKRPTQETSITHEFQFQSPDVYPTQDDWWELFPALEGVGESCTVESEQVLPGTPTPRKGSTSGLSAVSVSPPLPLSLPPLNSDPPSPTIVYDISPIMNVVDHPPSIIGSVGDVFSASELYEQQYEEASVSGGNMESYMFDLIQPYFFKASACMALSRGQVQREAWRELIVHLRLSLKGKTIAPPEDQRFFRIKKLYQLLEEQQTSVAGLIEYLRDIAIALNFEQLIQSFAHMFDSIITIKLTLEGRMEQRRMVQLLFRLTLDHTGLTQ